MKRKTIDTILAAILGFILVTITKDPFISVGIILALYLLRSIVKGIFFNQ